MRFSQSRLCTASLVISLSTCLLALFFVGLSFPTLQGQEKKPVDPWSSSETMQPGELAKMLTDKYTSVPIVVFVGFRSLYVGGHVPDSIFHGTASTEQGLSELKAWGESLSRDKELVIYCGCCPMDKCPNMRPAYTALKDMGFKKVHVLMLPTSFAVDWAEKGYPMQKGM